MALRGTRGNILFLYMALRERVTARERGDACAVARGAATVRDARTLPYTDLGCSPGRRNMCAGLEPLRYSSFLSRSVLTLNVTKLPIWRSAALSAAYDRQPYAPVDDRTGGNSHQGPLH